MADLSGIVKQLVEERDRFNAAIAALQGVSNKASGGPRKRNMSAAGRARIAAAQRARWAKFKRSKKQPS
jgi:hypothetical protein